MIRHSGNTKVKRGMVFWYKPQKCNYKTSVQQGIRPWLVVSNNICNSTSTICNIVPITSGWKVELPTHVFTKLNGRNNIILCEQMITVDQSQLQDYVCTVKKRTMDEVNKALAIQFSLQ